MAKPKKDPYAFLGVKGIKGKKYQVIHTSWFNRNYRGRIGVSRYDSVKESLKRTGFQVILDFTDEDHDGFYLNELQEIK